MFCGIKIAQSRERNITAAAQSVGSIDDQSLKRAPLLSLDIREQAIRLGQSPASMALCASAFRAVIFKSSPDCEATLS